MSFETVCFTAAMILYLTAFIIDSIVAALDKVKWYRFARICLTTAAFIATAALAVRWYNAGHPPLSNMYESLVTLSTFSAWVTLLFTRKSSIALAEAGVAVLAVLMIGLASLFSHEVKPLIPVLQSYWLYIHVSLAFLGESCFALAFVLSYLFCLRRLLEGTLENHAQAVTLPVEGGEKALCGITVLGLPLVFLAFMTHLLMRHYKLASAGGKVHVLTFWVIVPAAVVLLFLAFMAYLYRGAVGRSLDKCLPSAETLDDLTYKAIALGYPLFTVGALIFGMVWANKAWGRYWGWDPKETWALITFLVYSTYLHARLMRGRAGIWTAMLSIVGFLVTLFTLFGVNLLLAGLHSYASM